MPPFFDAVTYQPGFPVIFGNKKGRLPPLRHFCQHKKNWFVFILESFAVHHKMPKVVLQLSASDI